MSDQSSQIIKNHRESNDKFTEGNRKLKKVVFDNKNMGSHDFDPLVSRQIEKEINDCKSEVFNKTYSALPFKQSS